MYTIKTPSSFYCGVTYNVKFKDGVGETDDEELKDILINDFKYKLIDKEDDDEQELVDEDKQDDSQYSNNSYQELKSIAKEKGINTYKMNKDDIIKALKEGE